MHSFHNGTKASNTRQARIFCQSHIKPRKACSEKGIFNNGTTTEEADSNKIQGKHTRNYNRIKRARDEGGNLGVCVSVPTMSACPSSLRNLHLARCEVLSTLNSGRWTVLGAPRAFKRDSVLVRSHQRAKTSRKTVGPARASCWVNAVRTRT